MEKVDEFEETEIVHTEDKKEQEDREEQYHIINHFPSSFLNSSLFDRTKNSDNMENDTSDVIHMARSQSNCSEEVSGTLSITKGLSEEISILGTFHIIE